MALPLSFHNVLEPLDEPAVESAWLEHLADHPEDLETFVQVAAALEPTSIDLAKTLLDLLDSELRQQSQWNVRLELIKRSGRQFLKAGTIHQAVITTLEALYSQRKEDLAVLMPAVGLDKGRNETPKMWDKVERLRNLLTYEVGTVVAMKDKGVGRVVDVNLKLQTLKVDFERARGVSVGFRAAGKMLELLAEDHVLRRKLEQPKELRAMKPAQLLRLVLESYDRPLTGAEIKSALHGLVTERKWSSWWAAARKDPQVLASSDGRRAYTWASTNEAAEEHQWSEFEGADTRGKLDLLRRSGHLDADLLQRMVEDVADELERVAEQDPATALEIWTALERQPVKVEWQPSTMIAALADPVAFVTKIEAKAVRQRAYRLLRELPGWPELFVAAFAAESDMKTVQWLAESLAEYDAEHKTTLFDQAVAAVLRRFRGNPTAFVYLAERAAEEESLRELRPLRLVKQILSAIGEARFKDYRTKLLALCESGGTLPRLLSHLDERQARSAEEALLRVRGLDDYQRKPLINALHLRFPALRATGNQPLYTTASSLAAKREELRTLLEDELPANRKTIEEARELGDLRENFEYKAARQRHEYLSARATMLSQDLERAKLLEPQSIDPTEVRIGTRAVLESAKDERTLTILGPWESAPEHGIVSFESELAQKLLGLAMGGKIAIEGDEYEIKRIEVYEQL